MHMFFTTPEEKNLRGYFYVMQPKCNQQTRQAAACLILSGFESHVLR